MALSKSFTNSKKRKNDIYYTPEILAKDIINICDLKENDIVLDPFLGQGVFYNNYPKYVRKEWCEISKGIDFLTYDKKVDWIISNPPFSSLKFMIPKILEVATKGICLILGTNNLTTHRDDLFKKSGFNLTHIETFNVKSWFGFRCCVVIYEKNKESINKLTSNSY
jgi:type I restriction-modification system DNA methylase subunit